MKKNTLMVLAVCWLGCLAASAQRTYYFSESGNDANTGASPAAPKKSLRAAESLALPGNTLLFKRGDAWYDPAGQLNLSNKSGKAGAPVTVDAYGEGPKPVLAALVRLNASGWQRTQRSNVWKNTVQGVEGAYRLFINGVSRYQVNTSDSTAGEGQVDQPHEWYFKRTAPAGGEVYAFADAAPKLAELLVWGSRSALTMENSHYITVRNIDFRGGSAGNVIHIEAPSSHIIIDSCLIRQGNGSGIHAENSATGDLAPYVAHLDITNCLVDKVWTEEENDPAILLRGDGIFLRHAVDTGLIKGNTILNWGHSGISITSYALGVHGVHHLVVEENDVSNGASGYTHAIDMNGFEGLTTHNIIRRNYFHDYTVTGHILGNHNQIYSNIFAGVKVTKMPRHSHQGWGVDWAPWRYRGNGPWIVAHDNYLVNNTFADIESYGVMLGDHPTNPVPVNGNVIANNIIVGFGRLAVRVGAGMQGHTRIDHNNFWNGAEKVVRYESADSFSARELDSLHAAWCVGNTQLPPAFVNEAGRDFRLTAATPEAIRKGGSAHYAKVLGPGFTDYFGNPWDSLHPSMGAIQFGDYYDHAQETVLKQLGAYQLSVQADRIGFDAAHGNVTDQQLYDRTDTDFNFDNVYRLTNTGGTWYFRFGWQDFKEGRSSFSNIRWLNGRTAPSGRYDIAVVKLPFVQQGTFRVCTIGDSQTWWSKAANLRKYMHGADPSLRFTGSRTDVNGYPHEGEGGNSTAQVVERLQYIPEADCYTLLLGTNDWKKNIGSARANILQTVAYLLQQYPRATVLYITPLPVVNRERDAFNNRLREMLVKDFAGKPRVHVVPVGDDMRKCADWEKRYIGADGLHQTDAGVQWMAGRLAAAIARERK